MPRLFLVALLNTFHAPFGALRVQLFVRTPDDFSASLEDDYYEIINDLDRLYDFPFGHKGFINHLIINQIDTLMEIRSNIAYSIMSAKKNNSTYITKHLNAGEKKKTGNPSENIYSFVKTKLPDEVNILPMPQTLDDVWTMRSHPSMISFRKVINEWDYYINNEDISAAQKIQKDIIKANKYLEKLDTVKRCTSSPYVRTGYFIGGFIPILSTVVNIISFVEPYITNSLENKYGWTHISEKKKK